MSTLEGELRELIRTVVRDEVKRAITEATQPDEYLTIREAAAAAKVTDRTIRSWIRDGKLDAHRAGSRAIRIIRADLKRVLTRSVRTDRELTLEEMAIRDFG